MTTAGPRGVRRLALHARVPGRPSRRRRARTGIALHARVFGHAPGPESLVQVTRPAALPGARAARGIPSFPEHPCVLASLA